MNKPYAKLSSQQQAVESLAKIGDSAAVMAMASFLGNDDKEFRQLLVDGIGSVQDTRSIQILGQVIYGEPDPEIRMIAVRALAERQNEMAAHALLAGALDDPDEEVRGLASQLLIK